MNENWGFIKLNSNSGVSLISLMVILMMKWYMFQLSIMALDWQSHRLSCCSKKLAFIACQEAGVALAASFTVDKLMTKMYFMWLWHLIVCMLLKESNTESCTAGLIYAMENLKGTISSLGCLLLF